MTTGDSENALANYQNISYTYVNDTRLASVSGIGHTYRVFYDALGRCVVRTMDGSTSCYVYDGEKPIVEYGGSFAKTATNIYGRGIDEILQRTDFAASPTRTFYYQDDHEGSVTHLMMVVNSVPTVIESYRYDAFGKPTITNTSGILTNNRFLFTGREYVSQFGIYEYRNRAYHPGLGRFMSEDPKLFVHRAGLGKEPDKWDFFKDPDDGELNLFRYCSNDPCDLVDPMGLELEVIESISKGTITVTDKDNPEKIFALKASTGNNNVKDVGRGFVGPLPPGEYSIYERPGGMPLSDGSRSRAWILDRNDQKQGNDIIDGVKKENGGDRYGMRFHEEDDGLPMKGSAGCVVSGKDSMKKFAKASDHTSKGPPQHITSPSDKKPGDIDDFGELKRVGTWKVSK